MVAEGKLPPDLVKLHWFQQQEDGSTQITSTDLDQTGAFGDWPEGFAAVALDSESRYLDAAQARLLAVIFLYIAIDKISLFCYFACVTF